MKREASFTVRVVDNGFTVRITSDAPNEAKTLIAATPEEAVQLVTESVKAIVNPTAAPAANKK